MRLEDDKPGRALGVREGLKPIGNRGEKKVEKQDNRTNTSSGM
jgi:hypothetical protein